MMKYFTIKELCYSNTAVAHNINNTPNDFVESHLEKLVNELLDPLRESWSNYCVKHNLGNPGLKVTSGFRCPKLNSMVGGVRNSGHMFGNAADIQPVNGRQGIFEAFVSTTFSKTVKFDQIIIEKSKTSRW